jgi:hypothetical protein
MLITLRYFFLEKCIVQKCYLKIVLANLFKSAICDHSIEVLSPVQVKSWAEWALEKLNRLEQCKV